MKKKILCTLLLSGNIILYSFAQNVGIGTNTPNASSKLEINSTNSGLLIPRMTLAQRNLVAAPATGLMIYQTDNTPGFYFYNGAGWVQISTGGATSYWSLNGSDIFNNNAGNIGIGISTPGASLHIKKDLEALRLQGTTPYISFFDNAGPALKGFLQSYNNDLFLGTPSTNTTGIMQFYLKNVPIMTMLPSGTVGIGTSAPTSPLSFPNALGPKISLWNAGPNNDFGIGLNTGVMQFYTAGTDKISFGWGNTNAFNETLSIFTGSGLLSYPNVLGNKISFWRAGPNNDYGIGINTGVMQFFTAGTDKIAFGYGNTNAFVEKITFLTGSGQVGLGTTNIGSYQLAVNGSIHSKEVVVESAWADHVFADQYILKPLEEVEAFIKQHNHLPNIPSAKEIEEKGLPLGDVQKRMMEKIEELTLYVIELKKEIESLKMKQ
jgi:hypothetical protein